VGNPIRGGIERKMACDEDINFRLRHVMALPILLAGIERKIILAPDYEQARFPPARPGLPPGISLDVCAVIVKEGALDVHLSGLIEKVELIGPEIRVVPFYTGIIADVAGARCLQGEEVRAEPEVESRALSASAPRSSAGLFTGWPLARSFADSLFHHECCI
jgi:hypothetical protein